jgi:hypothetical protein
VFNWNVHKLALTLVFKRQQHRKLSWLDKDSEKDQSQLDELYNWTRVTFQTLQDSKDRSGKNIIVSTSH